MGKNDRNAASSDTDIHLCHSQPKMSTLPLQLTTCGARAMSGTVWDMTTHGMMARSAMLYRAASTAIAVPMITPATSPTSANRNVYHE